MSTWVVLASGPSMSQALADSIRGRCKAVAVSDCYRLAPWCDAIASTDAAWWHAHRDAIEMPCRKFAAMPEFRAVEGVERLPLDSGTNSGLLGIHAAVKLGATRILLCGFDMGGSHFFGHHKPPLKNPDAKRFEVFKRQFAHFRPRDIQILNCTPNSALTCYPFADLHECLFEPALHRT